MSDNEITSSACKNRVLSIQSHVVSGYVGNKCAVFPLQVLGFDVDFINSVQFSNHTGYGYYKGQVLGDKELDELCDGLRVNELLEYSQVLTGYVGSDSFLRKIREIITEIKEKNQGTIYLCDPVLGDGGKFYVPETLIPIYQKEILPLAHITTPNTFELELLSGLKVRTEGEALEAMYILHKIGVAIVVLTSLDEENGNKIITYASEKQGNGERSVWKCVGEKIPGAYFIGTGDLFSALFLAWWIKTNKSIPKTLQLVSISMKKVLQKTLDRINERGVDPTKPKFKELALIQSLDIIMNPLNEGDPPPEVIKLIIN